MDIITSYLLSFFFRHDVTIFLTLYTVCIDMYIVPICCNCIVSRVQPAVPTATPWRITYVQHALMDPGAIEFATLVISGNR